MVQLAAAAAAATAAILAVPAIAGPIHGSYLQSRSTESNDALDTRMIHVVKVLAYGPARSMVTKPIKDQAKEAAKGNSVRQPHQQTLSQKVYEQTHKGGGSSGSKQGKRDLEELDTRMIHVAKVLTYGPSRSMVTKPLKDQAKEAVKKGNSLLQPHQPTLFQLGYQQTHKSGSSGNKQGKRDLEELDTRMIHAVKVLTYGPARSIVTKPLKDRAKEAAKGNSVQQPHRLTLPQKFNLQTHKSGSSGSKQGKRDLDDELEARWVYEDLDELD
jgi:hypothetical protein